MYILVNISFSSFKPENWKVEFKPEKIDALEPNALKQVEVLEDVADVPGPEVLHLRL